MLRTKIVTGCSILTVVSLVFALFNQYRPSDRIAGLSNASNIQGFAASQVSRPSKTNTTQDKLLDGLLSPDFDETSCLSRYKSNLNRKSSPYKPSQYLLSKLRNYETLHRKCGPDTQSYKNAIQNLNRYQNSTSVTSDCKYIVWVAMNGLGNRMITLVSAFLYALLTNRVLLVEQGNDMTSLFCEPIPNTSWLLPLDFPFIGQFDFGKGYRDSYGNLGDKALLKSYIFLYLAHDYSHSDHKFFCEEDQGLISKIPWLILKTDNYFVPSLFSISSFEHELMKLFPEEDTVFHHLSRYIFHPSNQVWELVTRFYRVNLAQSDQKIGIQVRNFDRGVTDFKYVMDQILLCTKKEKILPEIVYNNTIRREKRKVVLITSLYSIFYENLKKLYSKNPAVAFFQPSHEEYQRYDKMLHDAKALSEMYLLSYSDVLITSGWSTFGYVAQGLGGLRPWILYKPVNRTTPDPACVRSMSMEPCFHFPPWRSRVCKGNSSTKNVVRRVMTCEDTSLGIRLIHSRKEVPKHV